MATDMRYPPVPGETASRRMADVGREFRARPAANRSLNEMKKGGKVTFKKKGKGRGKG